jgi:probable O-glycosylation ligase (exosortase A-associated)
MGGSDVFIAGVYVAFLVIGFTSPFAFTLGYLWVDTFYPQFLSTLVAQVQSSLIIGIAAVGGYLIFDRRSPPRFSAHTALALALAAWMTLSNTWAVWPASAWYTWDWSFKTVIFAAFMTFVLRSRVQMEAFLQVFLFSAAVHMIAVGTKTAISGSGYGRHLDVIESDAGLFEGSYLAGASIALIPIILFLRKHSILIPKSRFRDIGYYAMIGFAIFAAMGTYARTALVGFLVVGVFLWLQSRRKVLFTVCAVAVGLAVAARTADTWNERIETTADYNADSSALGRILVWEWTIKFASSNPLGGGFDAFMTDSIEFPGNPPQVVYGKAFHNAYIAVLGQQGFPGLAMYLALQGMSLLYLWRIGRRTKNQPHLLWVHDLAGAAMTALLTIMSCGCFIDIAYHSFVWYLMTFPVCLNGYLNRVEQLERGAAPLPWAAGRTARPALPAAARMAR